MRSAVRAGILVFTAVVSLSRASIAQVAAPQRAVSGPGEVRGKLVDSASGRALSTGNVAVRRDSVVVGGASVKEDGTFRIEGMAPGTYNIRARAIGYGQIVRTGIVVTAEKPVVDIGALMLNTVATKLTGQEVVAEREETVVQPDRTSYSTKNMSVASGGTAVDVLRNVPQVEVDGTNKVSLRGNGNVVIQINGRPTPLKGDQLAQFLAQMPANAVKTVEVAANPSAKDDPEGSAGIINIVLNQEAELGLSGGVYGGTSSTGQVNASGNIGKQQGPVTGFASLYMYKDRRNTSGTISRENLVIPVPSFTETSLNGNQKPLSLGGNVRGEYRFNEINSLTFDGYTWFGVFKNLNASSYVDLDDDRAMIGAYRQVNLGESRNSGLDFDLAFRRQGKPTEPQLTLETEFSNNSSSNDNRLSGDVMQSDPSTPAAIPTERDLTKGKYPYFMTKLDYTLPFNLQTKLETGGKYLDRSNVNEFTASYLNAASDLFELQPTRSTSFQYREHIGSAYSLFSRGFGKLQTQAGLRVELAQTLFDLPLTGQHFDKHYTSFYPSAVVTYNITDMRTLRTSFSRRVSRPNPWQLNPIEYKQDSRNVFRGNTDLSAEYTNAFDVNFTEAHAWGSLQINPFFRYTNNAVRNIQYIDANGISVGTFANLSHNQQIGTDLNVNIRSGKFQGAVGGSTSYYTSDAGNLALTSTNLSTRVLQWNVRGNGTWKFNPIWETQVFSSFRPATKTEGGSSLASVNLSMALRYKAWGDQGNISLRVNDPFNMQKFGYKTANGTVIESAERFFGARAVFLTISKNFGQAVKLKAKTELDASGGPTP